MIATQHPARKAHRDLRVVGDELDEARAFFLGFPNAPAAQSWVREAEDSYERALMMVGEWVA